MFEEKAKGSEEDRSEREAGQSVMEKVHGKAPAPIFAHESPAESATSI